MSETTFPFQSTPTADDAAAPEPPAESQQNKRLLLVVGGLVLAVAVAAAAYFLLFSGGGEEDDLAAVPPAPKSVIQPEAAPSVAPKTAVQPKVNAHNFGTDPFEPLIVEAAAATGDTSVTTGTSVDTSTAGTTTTPADTTTDGSTTGSTGSTGTTVPTGSESYRFQVMDVSSDNKTIDVKVNGKTYKALRAGEVFADIFKVRFVGGPSNSFQIGDEVFNVSGSKAVTISG